MKPTFALDLTSERITLLHRAGRGWVEVGAVMFGSETLDADVDVLRATAAEMSPRGITTKLILPDSQILYTRVPVTGSTDAQRRAEVAVALEGMTPYAVADLVFDMVADEAGMVAVAAVARETLVEAEAFAVAQRLNPVSFVGEAAAGWPTEPFFGPTAAAVGILAKGARVSRDPQPVLVRPAPVVDAVPVGDEGPADRLVGDASVTETPLSAPVVEDATAPDPASPYEPAVAANDETPAEAPAPVLEPAPTEPAPPEPAPIVQFDPPPPVSAARSEGAPAPAADPEPDEAPFTHVAEPTVPDMPPDGPPDLDVPPPAPAPAMMVAFASRRATAAPKAPPPPGTVAERLAQRAAALSQTARAAPSAQTRSFGAFEPQQAARRRPTEAPPVAANAPADAATLPAGAPAVAAMTATQPGMPLPATMPGASPATMPPQPRVTPSAPRKALTKPGGTFAQAAPARNRPRYLGLILTGVLLAFLALVAAWASFFLEARNDTGDTAAPVVAAVETTRAPALVTAAPVADVDEAAPPEAETAALPSAAAPPEAVPPAVPSPDAAPPTAPPPEAALAEGAPRNASPPEAALAEAALAEAALAEAETAALPPAGPPPEAAAEVGADAAATLARPDLGPTEAEGGDRIVISTAGPLPIAPAPPVLAVAAPGADPLPLAQAPPPAFGTVYQFDANGWIVPTAEGIITPDGVRLVAGAPPLLPPPRPASIAAAAAEAAASAVSVSAPAVSAAAPAALPEVDPAATFAADPSLQEARPQTRPPGLAPADDAALPAPQALRFASPRPQARPAEIVAAAAAADQQRLVAAAAEQQARRDAASLAAQAAAQSAVAAVVAGDAAVAPTSRTAISVSRVPAPRPRNLERAVAAAVQEATQPPPAAAAAIAPEDEDEPEVASAAPATPTRASVAEQATFANAISLRQINLIGVYGTEASRHALIRQANGRYKRVEVGDRIDGGTIAAITDDEVRYQKGGRLLALQMPGS